MKRGGGGSGWGRTLRGVLALLPPMSRSGVREGLKVTAPTTPALAVWGVVSGVAMVKAGLSVGAALLFNFVAFAGSAQVVTAPLLVAGAPLLVVWSTALAINLRFLIFAAATSRSFTQLPLRQRVFCAYFNGDVPYSLYSMRYGMTAGTPDHWGFYVGICSLNYLTWHASCSVGILLGNLAPASWGLELIAVLCLLALLLPMIVNRPELIGVIVTAVVAVATVRLPLRLGVLTAIVTGLVSCVAAERAMGPAPEPQLATVDAAGADR